MLLERNKYVITITKIEDAVNASGEPMLKCRGHRYYKGISKNNKRYNKFDNFSSIHLFGDPELFAETKERLFSQTCETPRLKIQVITGDIELPLLGQGINRRISPILRCFEYDFTDHKYGTIAKNRLKLKYNKDKEELGEESEFVLE